jgi:cytochrome c2
MSAEEVAAQATFAANRGRAAWLVAILIGLVLAALPFWIYHQVRLDAEQRQAAISGTGGNPDRAPAIIAQYGCGDCHIIPGISSATGLVGPELGGLARRVYVAGVITNTPGHLIAFIVNPQGIDEKSAMPRTGITAAEARDVAAYLYAIRQ